MKRKTIAKSAVDRNKEEIEMSTKDKNAIMNEGLKNRSYCLAVMFIILVALSINTFAQNRPVHVSDGYTPAGMAYGGFALDGIGRVNEFNGSLSVALPLGTVAGRGESGFQMNLRIEKNWLVRHFDFSPPIQTAHPMYHVYAFDSGPYASIRKPGFGPGIVVARRAGDIRYGSVQYPSVAPRYCATLSRVSFVGSDGSEIELRDRETNGTPNGVSGGSYTLDDNSTPLNRGNYFDSKDGSSITFISDSDIVDPSCADVASGNSQYLTGYPSGYLLFPNGTKYRVENGNVTLITDRNGNKTAIEYSTISYRGLGSQVTKITDSLGREIYISYSSTATTITKKGTAGEDRVIQINYANKPLRSDHSAQTLRQLFPSITWCATQNGCAITGVDNTYTEVGVTSVDLPNGQSYEFSYDPYGEVARIDLPTGGAFEYDYIGQFGSYSSQGEIITNYVSSGLNDWAISRRVSKQRIYNTGNLLQTETTYTNDGSPGINIKTRNASSALLAHSRVQFQGAAIDSFGSGRTPVTYDPQFEGRPLVRDEYDLSGNILRTQEFTWEQTGSSSKPENERLDEKQLTLVDANLVASETYEYDSYGNTTDVREYDYGSGQAGSFLRRTHTDFVTSSNYVSDSGPFIRRLPSQNWVSSDSAGSNKVSLIQFEYDDYSSNSTHAGLISRSSVTGHDSTNYGTGFAYRGNVTAVTTYSNAASQSGAVTVYSQYDILGNVVKAKDANGNVSTISYDDNFGSPDGEARSNTAPSLLNGQSAFAFATSSTNPLGWTTYSQFDYYLGEGVDEEDAYGVVDSTFYDDPLDRETKEIEANNLPAFRRQKRTIYDDTNRRIESRADLYAFGDELSKSESYYDGLGRTTESRDYESDGGYVALLTEYDSLGRVYRSTNPYRPLSNEQAKWKITRYDSLDRIKETETPDGGIMKTSFVGNETIVTDQALRSRKSQVDVLGRLKKIFEDPVLPNDPNPQNRLNYETSYDYDILGNLIGVTQGEQTRTFTYDSLSRLKTATNPESGTVTFTYDANNNLLTKTDARGTTVTHAFDALNRPVTKDYSDATPDAAYTYEDVNIPNSRGKLTRLETTKSVNRYTSFDVLGRTLASEQITSGQTYSFGYSYDLSGNLKSETYPSGRVANFEFDNDGDLAKVTGKASQNAVDRTYASNFVYTAHGAAKSMRLGNGKFESTQFNSTLQPNQIGLGSSVTDAGLWKLTYDYGATDNNGNVKSQTATVPTMGQNQGFTAVQTYAYDALNRLKQADEKPLNYTLSDCDQNPTKCWKQTFAYDRYGNRQFDLNQTSIPSLSGNVAKIINPTVNTQNNRFAADQDGDTVDDYKYDLSGNLTEDAEGRKFSYNGENKQTEVKDVNNQVTATYEYDGDGNRVKKTVPATGEVTIFVYDADGDLAAEYTINAPPTSNPTTNYLTSDALGSPRVITDNFGNVVGRRDFMPFGEEINAGVGNRTLSQKYDADGITQKFTRKERDKETGLDYFEARYYSSKWGRFTTSDEFVGGPEELIEFDGMLGHNPTFYAELAEPQSLNKYQYCLSNPLRYVDPDGHQATIADYILKIVVPVVTTNPELIIPAAIGTGLGLILTTPTSTKPYEDPFSRAKIGNPAALGPTVIAAPRITPNSPVQPRTQPETEPQGQPQARPTSPSQRPNRPNQRPIPRVAPGPQGKKKSTTKSQPAPGRTAGGRPTDKNGRPLGPSGRPMIHQPRPGSRKRAKDAARDAGNGKPMHHPSPRRGGPHFHPTRNGRKKQDGTHYNYD